VVPLWCASTTFATSEFFLCAYRSLLCAYRSLLSQVVCVEKLDCGSSLVCTNGIFNQGVCMCIWYVFHLLCAYRSLLCAYRSLLCAYRSFLCAYRLLGCQVLCVVHVCMVCVSSFVS